jgi:23S rRNA A2030 N6-methylase RlmJ
VLIDPPYEIKTDYQAVVTGIHEGYKRFATGPTPCGIRWCCARKSNA